jgi:hypothetical protein
MTKIDFAGRLANRAGIQLIYPLYLISGKQFKLDRIRKFSQLNVLIKASNY